MTDPRHTAFWERARASVPSLPAEAPEAWAFGATPKHADDLLGLVVSGIKTGTASSVWDYESTGEPLPHVGGFSIILDGAGVPSAVIRTTALQVLPFDEVGEEHAFSEGEGDRTLTYWRDVHERFWRAHSENDRGFEPDMPVLCELFELVHVESS